MRKPTQDMSMLSAQASRSHASRSQSQENVKGQTTAGICGPKPSGLFGKCDPVMRCVKTSQVLLAGVMGTSDEYLTTFPKAGMMLDGELYRRPTWERPISEKDSGYSHQWSTPIKSDSTGNYQSEKALAKGWKPRLTDQARTWRTPDAGTRNNVASPCLKLLNGETHGAGGHPIQIRLVDQVVVIEDRKEDRTKKGQLNPDWVGLLMGFPRGWTDLEPFCNVEWERWLGGFGNEIQENETENMRTLRDSVWEEKIQRQAGGSGSLSASEILQPEMCEQQETPDMLGNISLESKKAQEESVRSVRNEGETTRPSCGWDSCPQRSCKYSDSMYILPQIYPRYGRTAWLDGSWEDGVARTTCGTANRVSRLKALGNAQVPGVVALAWRLLTE